MANKKVKLLFLDNKLQIMLTSTNISDNSKQSIDNNLYIESIENGDKFEYDEQMLTIFKDKLNNDLYNSESFTVAGYELKIQVNKNGKQKQINFGSTGKRLHNLIKSISGNYKRDNIYVLEIDVKNDRLNIYEFFNYEMEFKEFMKNAVTSKNEPYAKSTREKYFSILKKLYENYKIYFALGKIETIMSRPEFPELNRNNNEVSATINLFRRFLTSLESENIGGKMEYQQKILIGPPGSGKSHLLNNEELGNVTRVVFHPDYDNSDFIGSILPYIEGKNINYKFADGPFTKIYKEAKANPLENYTLIIEEMTRGNCAAIFGEIFQLLDRDENGYSVYPITNYNIDFGTIKLPPNLSIVGTVNSSDQNVFPMDTAFKRRFDLEYIEPISKDDKDFNILGVSWKTLCASINNLICNNQHLAEDKQIGFYFIKDDTLKDIQKLCIYLWHDVDKFIHDSDDKILNHSNCNNYATFNKKIKEDSRVTDLFNKLISSELKNEEN